MIFTGRLRFERLINELPMGTDLHVGTIAADAAHAFEAYRIAYRDLVEHYKVLSKAASTDPSLCKELIFPYRKSFASINDGKVSTFTYSKRFHKLVYIAATNHSKIFIKLTERYRQEAHHH